MVMEAKKRIMFHGPALGIDLGFAGKLLSGVSFITAQKMCQLFFLYFNGVMPVICLYWRIK